MSAPDESKPQTDHESASNMVTADPSAVAGVASAAAGAQTDRRADDDTAGRDELALPTQSATLGTKDLRLLHAMRRVLEARQSDAWIQKIRARIAADLKWE